MLSEVHKDVHKDTRDIKMVSIGLKMCIFHLKHALPNHDVFRGIVVLFLIVCCTCASYFMVIVNPVCSLKFT